MSETWYGWSRGNENGEFHTFVEAGPIFDAPVEVEVGEGSVRHGFAIADLTPAS